MKKARCLFWLVWLLFFAGGSCLYYGDMPVFAQGEIKEAEDLDIPEGGTELKATTRESSAPQPVMEQSARKKEKKETTKTTRKTASSPETSSEQPPVTTGAGEEKKVVTLDKLVELFKKYYPDANFPATYVDSRSSGFDRKIHKALVSDMQKWREARYRMKQAQKRGAPQAEVTELKNEMDKLAKTIMNKYCVTSGPASEEETAVEDVDVEKLAPKSEKGRKILARLKEEYSLKEKEADESSESEEDSETSSETRKEKAAEKQKEAKLKPPPNYKSRLKWSPSRVTFNKIDRGATASSSFTLTNRGKYSWEGTIVPIEPWITCRPTIVVLEPKEAIEVEVVILAPDREKERLEGSIEIRTPDESSRRIPVVVRTK